MSLIASLSARSGDFSDVTLDPTGFRYPSQAVVNYSSTNRTITLTGNCEAYWRGRRIDALVSGWVSAAHTGTNGAWFLYYNGTDFIWSQTPWTFDVLLIAFVNYRGIGSSFALKETHGSSLSYAAHEELHEVIGTYRQSGGTVSAYVLASTTAANRRPNVASAVIKDEDNPTTLPALTSKLYTRFHLTGASTPVETKSSADIISLTGNIPNYNLFTGGNWTQAAFPNNAYGAIFLLAIPVTSDAESQEYRYMWIQPQTVSTTLATITALTPDNINFGDYNTLIPEFICIEKIVVRMASSNWTWISSTPLTGTKYTLVGAPAGFYLSSVVTDATLNGIGTTGDPLSVAGVNTAGETFETQEDSFLTSLLFG
jgi:hypothetical protein